MGRHALTLLSVAPEIAHIIPVSEALSRSFTFSREGNSRFWTVRLAHGLTDFLLACFADASAVPCSLSFENVDAADSLDQEFISVFLRRADPDELRVIVGTSSAEPSEPLLSALGRHARFTAATPAHSERESSGALTKGVAAMPPSEQRTHAERYVASDCTSDDVVARSAYALSSSVVRRELHLARATFLEATDEPSFTLGAIPLHLERAGSGVQPFLSASAYCMRMAYYEACLGLAHRGLALISSGFSAKGDEHGELARNALFSLLLLGRLEEVERYCREIASTSKDPALLSHGAYAMAILYARAYPDEKRDFEMARTRVQEALTFAELVPESETRTVNLVFLRNTLALVEMRIGRPELALHLLSEGITRLEREAPSKCERESIILFYNRARLHVVLGDLPRAIEDYTTLLLREPSNSEAHMDRGILYQRLGRFEEALADYEEAIAWSPPYDEAHFNRAQMLVALDRKDEAISAYSYVLGLEPEHRGALINRGGLLFEMGELSRARQDVERALSLDSVDAKAWCLLGLLEMTDGRPALAYEALTRAIDHDATEASAWINRATVLSQRGDLEDALRDLDRALHLREDVTALCNRAAILQFQKRWHDAIADYSRALALAGCDVRDAENQLRTCCDALDHRGD